MINEEYQDDAGYKYRHNIKSVEIVAKTHKPIYKSLPIRGRLVVNEGESKVFFTDFIPEQHARNKVVFRTNNFSVRITEDGTYSITSHIKSEDVRTEKHKKLFLAQFLKLLTFISTDK